MNQTSSSRFLRQIFDLLGAKQRRSAVVLLLLMFVGMVLETLGVGLVIPILGVLSSQDPANDFPLLAKLFDLVGERSREEMVVGGMIALVVVFAIKSLFLAFLAWRQAKFVYGVQADLSQRLFDGYLRQPWVFHLQRNSAQLIRNATVEIHQFTGNVLMPLIITITESLIFLGIGVLLVLVEPLGAIVVVSILGMAAWIFQYFTRERILSWGKARQFHDGLRIQHLQQGLGGAKDVKLLGRETEFLDQYDVHNLASASAARRQNVMKQLPRLWLEFLAVLGLASLVLIMFAQGKPLAALLPTLGLFAAAAFRLLPSANRLLANIQSMRYGIPVVQTLHDEFETLGKVKPSQHEGALPFQRSITLRDVSFRYPETNSPALSNIGLEILKGSTVGFVGGSGAGKSTLVDVILGLLTPTQGRVEVDGADIQTNMRGWQNQIGYVPQNIFLIDDTLRHNIALGIAKRDIDDEAVAAALRAAQLERFVASLPEGANTVVGERGVRLSGGQRQRIGIARALYHDPNVLVLDEATSSLDVLTEKGVMSAVNALHGEKTILIVAHRLSTVEGCDRLFRLEEGKLVAEGDADFVLKLSLSGSS